MYTSRLLFNWKEFVYISSVLWYTVFIHKTAWAFNVDTQSAVVHEGTNGTMFGYAVALHKDRDFSWLLVGAPKAQTAQPDVEKGGAVFRCSISSSNVCQMIPFDISGPGKFILKGKKEDIDEKSNQWFGATVQSSGENGIIVACAPRYVYFSSTLKRKDPVGTCWVVRASFTNFKEYSPCRTKAWGYHRQGSCQAGFSAAVSKDGRRLFIGAVGSWYWQGQVFSQDILSKNSLYHTPEAPDYDDDSYLGYSMGIGEFTGDRDPDVVVGMPRGDNLMGKVALFNSTMFSLRNITGEQLGAYFGYSVCALDINGDGLDDLIIGAPFYTDLTAKDGSYEKGRVYTVYQSKQHSFTKPSHIDGIYSRGKFGLSLVSLSDIDGDGFNDFAVGCPYGGKNGNGVVYIFHGTSSGVIKRPSQEITSESIPNTPPTSTFGWSLSGGLDLDNNAYPDLLVGAYESDKAIFLRSRAVVQVSASLKINPSKINLDDKGCKLENGVLVSCLVVSFCLEFTGVGIEPTGAFVYHIQLDAQNNPRVFFLSEEDQNEQNVSVNVQKESKYCKSVYAYIQNNVRDKLTPIIVTVIYNLNDLYSGGLGIKPILDKSIANNLTKQVNIQKNCGGDNICIPDIKLQIVPNMHQFLIGSTKRLELEFVIVNAGEDAFETMLYGSLPSDVGFVNIAQVRPMDIPVRCIEAQSFASKDNIVCDIGNPLPFNITLTFKLLLAPSKSFSSSSDLKFDFIVNSTNEEIEETLYDNNLHVVLPVRVEVNITIHGISEPQIIVYNKTEVIIEQKDHEMDAGPEVIHVYAIGNKGPSMIKTAEIDILWPAYTLQNRPLLYLMEQPEVQGKGQCNEVLQINPLSLKKQKKAKSSSYSINIAHLRSPLRLNNITHIFGKIHDTENIRITRQAMHETEMKEDLQEELSCGPTLCSKITCSVHDLGKHEQVIFTIRSRLWKDTLIEMSLNEVEISSKLISRITSLPHGMDPSFLGLRTYFVTTKVNSDQTLYQQHVVPVWIILSSVCCGFLILGALALILWRLGFFQRKRAMDQLKEPLHQPHKNEYHLTNGDEYL